ncbi:MAG: putative toxin-antitoxin system toxin component, PIN family [Candidatus Aenigmatarchaeota archaeon]
METRYPPKIVIDTNLIIAARYNPKSASSKVIDLCIEHRLLALYSEKTRNENLNILLKVQPSNEYLIKIRLFFSKSIYIPDPTTRVNICSDYSDNKYFETAIDAGAQYIISNDKHLLEHDGYYGVRVMRPSDFLKKFKSSS